MAHLYSPQKRSRIHGPDVVVPRPNAERHDWLTEGAKHLVGGYLHNPSADLVCTTEALSRHHPQHTSLGDCEKCRGWV